MSGAAKAVVIAVALCVINVAGDYLLKRASDEERPFVSWWFAAGFALYSSTSIGWVYVMRHMKFSMIGVVYSTTTVLLLALVGVFVLHEGLRWQEALGIGTALAVICLLARFA